MKNNHLTYFKIENFKKFDSLEVNDIGQFNLIVGDNNVGKTCLLEALLFDEDGQQLLNNFYLALTKRGLKFHIEKITREINGVSTTETNYPKENYFNNNIIRSKSKQTIFYFNTNEENEIHISPFTSVSLAVRSLKKGPEIELFKNRYNEDIIVKNNIDQFVNIFIKKEKKTVLYWIYDYNERILNFPLISFNDTPLEQDSRNIYENFKTKREKQILIDVLKVVNSKIVDIEFRERFDGLNSFFLISFDDEEDFIKLNNLGDGFKRIFYIVLKMLSLKGKRILIDEIEIGIHYSKMKDFWVNIMKVCKELDVQLFATTHSQECIEAYLEASKEIGEKDIRLIRLQENKDKSIKAICYKEDYIEYLVESNTEER